MFGWRISGCEMQEVKRGCGLTCKIENSGVRTGLYSTDLFLAQESEWMIDHY